MKRKYYYPKVLTFKVLDIKTRNPIINPIITLNDTIILSTSTLPFTNINTPFTIKVTALGYNTHEHIYTYADLHHGEINLTKELLLGLFNINLTWEPIDTIHDLDLHLYIYKVSDDSEVGEVWFSKKELNITGSDGNTYTYTLDYDDDTGSDSIKNAHTENISGLVNNEFYYKIVVHDFPEPSSDVKSLNPTITITFNNEVLLYQCNTSNLDRWSALTIKENLDTGLWECIPDESTTKI